MAQSHVGIGREDRNCLPNASITHDRERLIETGIDDYTSKPLSPPQLSEKTSLLPSASVLGKYGKQFEQPEEMLFDRDALLTRVDGDITLLNEAVGIFLADYPSAEYAKLQ